jgi:YHS domain-containing protein
MATAIDPICKMDVDTENPPGGQSEHDGTTYYFCAPGCKVAFDKEPERYLTEDGAESGSHGHHHDHDHGHGHEGHQEESKPGFFARLFGKK